MSVVVVPPGRGRPDDLLPGQTWMAAVNDDEWLATQLRAGDPIRFKLRSWTDWRRGTFKMSYLYDGVVARVTEDDPDDLIEHSIFPSLGDRLEAL